MDFEDKKENIQPLRGGRVTEHLEHALESIETWEESRKLHEEQIKNYTGDDPVQLWYDYICWIEQTNISGDKPKVLEDVVRRSVQEFENDPRYLQDHRFIKLCIKYIDSQPSPVELYNELYNRGVGTLCAELYIGWAYYYDALDNFAKTEEIFQKGIAAGAEPKSDLEQAHTTFGFSMSQRLLHKDECSKLKFQSTLDERRNALTSLRTSRKKYVGSIRTGLAVKSYRPGTVNQENMPSNASTHNAPANTIVYTDQPGSSGLTNSIVRPFSSVHNEKENIIESARLAKSQGTHKKSVLFPKHQYPSFDIPIDEVIHEPLPVVVENYSRGIQYFGRSRNIPQTPFEVNICVGDPKEWAIPMYDKIRLYCRAGEQRENERAEKTEFSPEELQAYRYFKSKGIENEFTAERARVWGHGYEIGIRLHPLHARESKSKEKIGESESNPKLEECYSGIQTKIAEIYANSNDEKSIEELLMLRWREGKIKKCVDRRYQDDIDPVDMDETQVESQRVSIGGSRFSIAPPMAQMRPRKSVFPAPQPVVACTVEETDEELRSRSIAMGERTIERQQAQPESMQAGPSITTAEEAPSRKRLSNDILEQETSKKEDTKQTPMKSAINLNLEGKDGEIEKENHVSVAVSKKIEIFVDDSDEIDEAEELAFAKPRGATSPNEQQQPLYYPNDSCSTQMFNMFVKNISTPVGPLRKQQSMQAPATSVLKKRPFLFTKEENSDDGERQSVNCKQFPLGEMDPSKCARPPCESPVYAAVPEAKINDENAVPIVEGTTTPSTSSSTCSTYNSTHSNKQLSTIMERTETSTTGTSAVLPGVTKSSVEMQPISPGTVCNNADEEANLPLPGEQVAEQHTGVQTPKDDLFKMPVSNEPQGFGIHIDSTETMAKIPLLLKRDLPPVIATTVDDKENNCIVGCESAGLTASGYGEIESRNATPLARGVTFPLSDDLTSNGNCIIGAGSRNLSHMVQHEMDANSIASFRMTTERTNTMPLQLVKPQYTIQEVVSNVGSHSSISSTMTGDSSTIIAAPLTSAVRNAFSTEPTFNEDKAPVKNNHSLLELLDAKFSPEGGGREGILDGTSTRIGRREETTMANHSKERSTNLSAPKINSKPTTDPFDLSDDVSDYEVGTVPAGSFTELSLLAVPQVKMEKSLALDASLDLPKFTVEASSHITDMPHVKMEKSLSLDASRALTQKATMSATEVPCTAVSTETAKQAHADANAQRVVLDEFLSPLPPAAAIERNSLDEINTAVFSLNINRAMNSTIIQEGYQTPHKQMIPTANSRQGSGPVIGKKSVPFIISEVKGGVTDHPSLLFPAGKEAIVSSLVTASKDKMKSPTVAAAASIVRRVSPFQDATDADASIYHPRPVIPQEEETWEEIDEHFDPKASNEYQRKAIDMDCTIQHVNALISADEIDPFDKQMLEAFLDRLDFMNYISDLPNCSLMNKLVPLKKGTVMKLPDDSTAYEIQKKIGKGAYGTVFCANNMSTKKQVALKQERPANLWEFYICLEIRSRLTNPDILPGFMSIEHAIVGNNASIFVSAYSRYGNILDVCNLVNKATNRNMDEFIAMILSAQILSIVDHLHSCQIIHADIKPDNFLFMSPIDMHANVPCLQLIDFGESIDMKLFEKDVQFKRVVTTYGFTCIEMMENRPWTYQPDLFGVAGTSHVMLFGKYMQVEKHIVNWGIKTAMPRYFKKAVWENYFSALLNIRDCDHLPNLQNLRTAFLEEIALHEKYIGSKIVEFNHALASCK